MKNGDMNPSEIERAQRRIIVALDVATEADALRLVEGLRGHVGMFKIGLELFTSLGPSIVRRVRDEGGEVFLDCKYIDIPATVAGAARAAASMGVRMLNVHCFGGRNMMMSAMRAAQVGATESGHAVPLVLGVTVLTSLDSCALQGDLGIHTPLVEQVLRLTSIAISAGLDGVIASPQEIGRIRAAIPNGRIIVTPGVRPTWAEANDQRRVATPAEAVMWGADFIVVGRPITRPPVARFASPKAAALRVAEEIVVAG